MTAWLLSSVLFAAAYALILEAITIARDPRGVRLGDAFAGTQVVDGFGLKELAAEIKRTLSAANEEIGAADPAATPARSSR